MIEDNWRKAVNQLHLNYNFFGVPIFKSWTNSSVCVFDSLIKQLTLTSTVERLL